LPLIVLTRNPQAPQGNILPAEWTQAAESLHQRTQVDLAKLSTQGKHVIASKAGHNIQFEEPQLVIDSILELVRQARRE
jgi:pimeloyl-ACP methyl ester carboxylesterase